MNAHIAPLAFAVPLVMGDGPIPVEAVMVQMMRDGFSIYEQGCYLSARYRWLNTLPHRLWERRN